MPALNFEELISSVEFEARAKIKLKKQIRQITQNVGCRDNLRVWKKKSLAVDMETSARITVRGKTNVDWLIERCESIR